MSQPVYFHFTLGPVQSFVAQARRTRDFWAGSFILSWLSAVAVQEVIKQCEDPDAILFPKPESNFMKALNGEFKGRKNAPRQGSIPNRFKAKVDGATFNPNGVEKAVDDAWKALADLVYDKDFEYLALEDKPCKVKWNLQIEGCWEISWSYSPVANDGVTVVRETPVLDQRKHWRSYTAPDQPGVKCMMMDGWQELSGAPTPYYKADGHSGEKWLDAFWEPLRASQHQMKTDIRKNEYLCAIAFVKRRFSRHFKHLSVSFPSGWNASGWVVDDGRPSVTYMAAANWWAETLQQANTSESVKACVTNFYNAASDVGAHGEWESSIKCIDDVDVFSEKPFRALDGDLFFESVLENPRRYETPEELDKGQKALRALKELNRETIIGSATPFYAVLMMDGDGLGIQMQEIAKQADIAQGLQTFTNEVPNVVKDNSGFLVYAGGDDVLAVLPMDNAMACALAVRECYEKAFEKYREKGIRTSISAAIEYAHIRMPLMKILKDAHQLLDGVAKDKAGRDALAARVWKPGGGIALEWSQSWDVACDGQGEEKHLVLDRLAKKFRKYERQYDPQGQYSNKFFYKIRDCLELFNPPRDNLEAQSTLTAEDAVNLMAAEYVASGLCEDIENKAERLEIAKIKVKPLIEQCRSVNGHYKADAALLMRILAQKGMTS